MFLDGLHKLFNLLQTFSFQFPFFNTLHRRYGLFNLFISLHSAFRNENKLNTYTNLDNGCGGLNVWTEWFMESM